MLKKHIHSLFYLILGSCCVILGFTSIFIGKDILKVTLMITSLLVAFNGLFKIGNYLFEKKHERKLTNVLLSSTLDIATAIFIEYNVSFVMNSLTILMGIYLLINSIIQLCSYIIYIQYNINGRLTILLKFISYLVISLLLISAPATNIKYAQLIVGIYLLVYGISRLIDFLIETIPKEKTNALKSLIKIPLPLFISAFVPQRLINLINELLKTDNNHKDLNIIKDNEQADLEVIIHLAEKGTAAFGHIEVCFNNKIYSYGNYDRHSRKLFDMIGDGVILIADRDKYIEYNVKNLNRYLVCFGIKLTEKQKSDIQKRITFLISNNTTEWHSDQELSDKGIIPKEEFHDISSDLYRLTNGKFKKITTGKNKKFFVLKTNCAIIVDYILGSISSTILNINGLIAPGTYYEYLNNEFLKNNSFVTTRKIYTLNDFNKD